MAGDFSRSSVNPTKHYSGVLMQQGRVQVDADWNEQLALQRHRTFAETRDVIGRCGTPKHHDGFKIIQNSRGLFISPGRFYVDGLLCEWNPEIVEVGFPDRPGFLGPPVGANASAKLRQTAKKVSGSNPAPPSGAAQESSTTQVIVPSNILDERLLASGDWVVITAEAGPAPLWTMVIGVSPNPPSSDPNSIIPNSYTLTLDDSVSGFTHAQPVHLSRALTLTTQPYSSSQMAGSVPQSSGPDSVNINFDYGLYVIFLEAWQREVNALEDPHIREVALGGPDTAERLQTVWQVQALPLLSSPPSPSDCCAELLDYESYKSSWRTTSRMNARTIPPQPGANLCAIPPAAGYQSLENQLYRVEIFLPSSAEGGPTFVWSRDNGSVETSIVSVDSNGKITVPDLGKDDLHALGQYNWVEVVDPDDEFRNNNRFLAQISAPPDPSDSGPVLTVQPPATIYAGKNNLCLRRWDMPQNSILNGGVPVTPGWMDLENNIQVNFTDGQLAPRSFWQIPARTATGDIEWPPFPTGTPNVNPIPQLPLGVEHHFCKLALLDVTVEGMSVQDCRAEFPSLTHICADDVCYKPGCPDLADAKTVQQALDELCQQEDLKFHKKELHGWGVVCGLQVTCGAQGLPSGRGVTVQTGYAIGCEGEDILFNNPVPFDVISAAEAISPGVANGDYSLIIDPSANDQLRLMPYQSPSPTDAIFHGGIWEDFYNEYVKWLIDYINSLSNEKVPPDVTPAQKLETCFSNLYAQYQDPNVGSHVYISIEEYDQLKSFYVAIRKNLIDKTFCGFLSEARPFPAYLGQPADKQMRTVFGTGNMAQLRIAPDGKSAFAVGTADAVEFYDFTKSRLQAILAFPIAGAFVQDVGISPDSKTLYAIATINGGKDSVFAVKPVNSISSDWQSTTFPGKAFAKIAVDSSSNSIVVSAVGEGLYSFSLSATTPGKPPQGSEIAKFNAIGHLVTENGFAYASADQSTSAVQLNVILCVNLRSPDSPRGRYELPPQVSVTPTDDLAVAPETSQTQFSKIYVSAGPPPGSSVKQLHIVKFAKFEGASAKAAMLPLDANDTIRLGYNANFPALQLTYKNLCQMRLVQEKDSPGLNPEEAQFAPGYYPTEVGPISMQFSSARKEMLILNQTSNSITAAPFNPEPWTAAQIDALLNFRNQLIDSVLDLFHSFLQYWKDGFCYLLLHRCPQCTGEDPIVLAAISVQNQSVYKICNFSGRKYVKSFPTVEYWLSVIPILPIVKYLLGNWCCSVLNPFVPPPPQPTGATTTSTSPMGLPFGTFAGLASIFKGIALGALMSVTSKAASAQSFAGDFLINLLQAPPSGVKTQLASLIGQPAQTAKETLAANNISLSTLTYDPSVVTDNVTAAIASPSEIEPGSSVTAFVDQNKNIRYFSVTPPAIQQVEASTTASVTSLQGDMSGVKTDLATLQQSQSLELAKRDQLIAMLTQQLRTHTASLSDLTSQVQTLSKKISG